MRRRELPCYLDGLYSYAFSLTQHRPAAEYLVQEACAHVFPAMNDLRDESARKVSLFAALHGLWIKGFGQEHRGSFADSGDVAGDPSASGPTNRQDHSSERMTGSQRQRIRGFVRQLPLDAREMLALRECGQLSPQEIACVLNCSVEMVMSRLSSARSKLRALLAAAEIHRRVEPFPEARD